MNIKITDPWIAIPAAAVYCGLGAIVSGAVFNKLSHLIEYTLNKTFGDYENLRKTLDGNIIVSMSKSRGYYYAQNVVLATVVAAISIKAVQILAVYGCPRIIAVSLLVGDVVTPILFGLFNMIARQPDSHHTRWVELSEAQISKNGIDKSKVEKIRWSERVYCGFGQAPKYFPGWLTNS